MEKIVLNQKLGHCGGEPFPDGNRKLLISEPGAAQRGSTEARRAQGLPPAEPCPPAWLPRDRDFPGASCPSSRLEVLLKVLLLQSSLFAQQREVSPV